MIRRASRATLFPYTTLFRSIEGAEGAVAGDVGGVVVFWGIVRDREGGQPITALEYTAYREMVEHQFRKLLDQRSEEHTSELQSRQYLVCRLLLEKKKVSKLIHDGEYHVPDEGSRSREANRLKAEYRHDQQQHPPAAIIQRPPQTSYFVRCTP